LVSTSCNGASERTEWATTVFLRLVGVMRPPSIGADECS
jgi:hypothetical protein